MTWAIMLTFRDREGNEAQSRLHTSGIATYQGALAFASALLVTMGAISDARIVKMVISRATLFDEGNPASDDSMVSRIGVFALALENGYYSLVIVPSIRNDLGMMDEAGKPRFVLNPESEEMLQFASAITGTLDDSKTAISKVVIAGIAK